MRGQLLKINEERAELISLENRMELPVDGKGQNGPLFWMHLEHSSSEEWEDILTMLKLSSDDKAPATFPMRQDCQPEALSCACRCAFPAKASAPMRYNTLP